MKRLILSTVSALTAFTMTACSDKGADMAPAGNEALVDTPQKGASGPISIYGVIKSNQSGDLYDCIELSKKERDLLGEKIPETCGRSTDMPTIRENLYLDLKVAKALKKTNLPKQAR